MGHQKVPKFEFQNRFLLNFSEKQIFKKISLAFFLSSLKAFNKFSLAEFFIDIFDNFNF